MPMVAFPASYRDDGELRLALLNKKYRVRRIALSKDGLLLSKG